MTTLVLLPSMGGTGDLFGGFASALRSKVHVVRYPTSRPLDYGELKALVRAELPVDEPYVLLGEPSSVPSRSLSPQRVLVTNSAGVP